jgi:hypothetical protein
VGDLAAARGAWRTALDILEELGHPDVKAVHAKTGRGGLSDYLPVFAVTGFARQDDGRRELAAERPRLPANHQ